MSMVFCLFLLPITVADIRNRVIPNIYLKLLTFLMLVSFIINGVPQSDVYLPGLLLIMAFFILKIGMGDLKLLLIITLTFNCQIISLLALVSIGAVVHIAVSTARFRSIPDSIPLAPAIFFGFVSYLAVG